MYAYAKLKQNARILFGTCSVQYVLTNIMYNAPYTELDKCREVGTSEQLEAESRQMR